MTSNETRSRTDPASTATPKTVGEQVPDFELPGVGEDGINQFELSQFTHEGALIISFYPFDFSLVCTEQLCGFRDAEWLTLTENVDVVGISVDSAYSHKQFRAEYDLPFPLLTDRLAEVADAFGVKYDTWEHHPAVCQRVLFAVDDDHTIRFAGTPRMPVNSRRWTTFGIRSSGCDEARNEYGSHGRGPPRRRPGDLDQAREELSPQSQ